jgi:hypothetical protein
MRAAPRTHLRVVHACDDERLLGHSAHEPQHACAAQLSDVRSAPQPQRTILKLCETFALAYASARLGAHRHRAHNDEVHADICRVYADRLAVLGGTCTRALSATCDAASMPTRLLRTGRG